MSRKYNSLSDAISDNIDQFFKMHENTIPDSGLYERVIQEVEKILIQKTLQHVGGVQSKAASILGLSRNTLRTKIKILDIK
jgi:two-component system nitrogen regulation response regulator GlnG